MANRRPGSWKIIGRGVWATGSYTALLFLFSLAAHWASAELGPDSGPALNGARLSGGTLLAWASYAMTALLVWQLVIMLVTLFRGTSRPAASKPLRWAAMLCSLLSFAIVVSMLGAYLYPVPKSDGGMLMLAVLVGIVPAASSILTYRSLQPAYGRSRWRDPN